MFIKPCCVRSGYFWVTVFLIRRSTIRIICFFEEITNEMKVLYYNELDTSPVKKQFERVEQYLREGNFSAADVKKMPGTGGYYRARLDKENRLLFRFAEYKGEQYLLLLEVILNHAYEKSKFLRGASLDESKFLPLDTNGQKRELEVQRLNFVNPQRPVFHLLDKPISFDEAQQAVFNLPLPLVLIGSAGSGKTALTLEKMKQLKGRVAYVSLSPYLVENAQRIYDASGFVDEGQEIDFISFHEYLQGIKIPGGREITFRDFDSWYIRYRQSFKFREPYKLYEEFRGVLTGSVVDKQYMGREDYLGLGIKQSIFPAGERKKVYDLFEKYLAFLQEAALYDPNMVAHSYLERVKPQYDFMVIDEVQDITNIQLLLLLKSLHNPLHFMISGDSNQIVHPNFFSWSKVKTLFFKEELGDGRIHILKTNYRNSQAVTRISNLLLKLKNVRFGSIDRESTYLVETVSDRKGAINFFADNAKIRQELNQKTRNSAKYAILTMDPETKAAIGQHFDTPLVFTIQEAKGLEYENIILVNFISGYEKEFREVSRDVSREALEEDTLQYARAKDKGDKELEAYKFYINSLYVAFTRAVQNLYMLEANEKHELLKLLDIVQTEQKLKIEAEQSSEEEWLEEARRLEKQGKFEQARAIRDRLQGLQYLSPEQAAELIKAVFAAEKKDPQQCRQLFDYARSRHRFGLIIRLKDEARFGPAKSFMQEYGQARKNYLNQCRNGNLKKVQEYTRKFGIDFRSEEEEMTGLMMAVRFDKQILIDYFLEQEADKGATDYQGRNVLQLLMMGFGLGEVKEHRFGQLYPLFETPWIKVRKGEQIRKISNRTMEYFLLNYILAVRDTIIDPQDPPARQGLRMDEFMEDIERMPGTVLPEYRRQRQYVNAILAKSEVNSSNPYNRELFVRKSRGCYNVSEEVEVVLD